MTAICCRGHRRMRPLLPYAAVHGDGGHGRQRRSRTAMAAHIVGRGRTQQWRPHIAVISRFLLTGIGLSSNIEKLPRLPEAHGGLWFFSWRVGISGSKRGSRASRQRKYFWVNILFLKGTNFKTFLGFSSITQSVRVYHYMCMSESQGILINSMVDSPTIYW